MENKKSPVYGYMGSLLATISYICFLAVPIVTMYNDGITFENACNTAGYIVGIAAYTSYTYADYYNYKTNRIPQNQLFLHGAIDTWV